MGRRIEFRVVAVLAVLLSSGCGGGTQPSPAPPPPPPPPPPAPPPVASVTVSPDQAGLVPQETVQLTASVLDASGNPLSGRTISWSTSATGVATVSAAGLVTAVGEGNATITATSEGRSGSATIAVADGGFVGATGGTVVSTDGNVTLSVPAGAVAAGMALTVTQRDSIPDPPDGGLPLGGTWYQLGPEGTQFSNPVTVTLKYDLDSTPPWALAEDITIYRHDGTQWSELANVQVDTSARTVSGETPGFSTFAIVTNTPGVAIDPSPGSVNSVQRSVALSATVQGHAPGFFTYNWSTTGTNGSVNAQFGNTIQYTATAAILPNGDLDQVGVDITAPLFPGGPSIPIGQAVTTVKADLGLTVQLNPFSAIIDFGETKSYTATVRDANGNAYNGTQMFEWSTTTNAGTLDLDGAGPTQTATATYTAKPASGQVATPPRGDQITVKTVVQYRVADGTLMQPHFTTIIDTLASADSFVEVGPNTYPGRFKVQTDPTPAGACVTAYVFAPIVAGVSSNELIADHFNDTASGGYGTEYRRTFTGATGTGFNDVQVAGNEWRIALDGGCNTTQQGIQFRQNLYAMRFAGIEVRLVTTP